MCFSCKGFDGPVCARVQEGSSVTVNLLSAAAKCHAAIEGVC